MATEEAETWQQIIAQLTALGPSAPFSDKNNSWVAAIPDLHLFRGKVWFGDQIDLFGNKLLPDYVVYDPQLLICQAVCGD